MRNTKGEKKNLKTVTYPAPEKELLTTKEAALFLERTEYAIQNMAYLGIIQPLKLRGRCYYRKSVLIHWIVIGRPFSTKKSRALAKVIPMYPVRSGITANVI